MLYIDYISIKQRGRRAAGKNVSSQKKKSWKEKKKKRMKYLELQTMKMNTSTCDPHKICNYDTTIFFFSTRTHCILFLQEIDRLTPSIVHG